MDGWLQKLCDVAQTGPPRVPGAASHGTPCRVTRIDAFRRVYERETGSGRAVQSLTAMRLFRAPWVPSIEAFRVGKAVYRGPAVINTALRC